MSFNRRVVEFLHYWGQQLTLWSIRYDKRFKPKPKPRERVLRGHPSECVSSYVHKPIMGPDLAPGEQIVVREVRKL